MSASRVRRAQESATATRPYTAKARDLLASVASLAGGETRHPLLTKRDEVKNVTIVLISADRGLAGAFNSNVGRIAFNFGREQTAPVSYVTYGKKGRDFVFRRGGNVIADYSPIPARPVLLDTTPITRQVIEDFLEGKTDEVWLAYTDYVSAAIQKPTLKKLLPLAAEELLEGTKSDGPRPAYDFEPDPQGILDTLLPRLTEMQVYQAVLESLASEHTARMVAMRNATDNASDLILSLTLTYNKARQQAITSELLDIAGGTEALK